MLQGYLFSLLVQAAGTVLLFVVFLLLYRKFRRPAFLDWIASWGFFLGGLALLWFILSSSSGASRFALLLMVSAMLGHVYFLLRGVWRFRKDRASSRPVEMLWAVPILALSFWLSAYPVSPEGGWRPPVSLVRGAAYLLTAAAFAFFPGSVGGRAILSCSFLFWGIERLVLGVGYLRYGTIDQMPVAFQYAHFFEMFLEMTVGVGIIILLFEASQAQLQQEMQRLVESDSQVKEMGIRDRLTGLYNRHYFNDVIRRELARTRCHGGALSVLLIDVDRFKEINDVRGTPSGTRCCSSWRTTSRPASASPTWSSAGEGTSSSFSSRRPTRRPRLRRRRSSAAASRTSPGPSSSSPRCRSDGPRTIPTPSSRRRSPRPTPGCTR